MKVIGLIEEDFVNYKKPSLYIAFPTCSFKCGRAHCQNKALANVERIEVDPTKIVERYMDNPITKAIVFGGLEPFDSWEDLQSLITQLRYHTPDDIVIYSGYTEEEIADKIEWLSLFENIIIKFGRYIPGGEIHFDELLGVQLASPNQYSKKYNAMEGYC